MNFENYSDTLLDLKLFNPDAVFINLGGNSIKETTQPSKLAENIIDIVNELKHDGVKRVFVCEITECGDVRFYGVVGMNFENYSDTILDLKLFKPDAVFINLGGNSIKETTQQRISSTL